MSEFVPIEMQTVDYALSTAVPPVDVVNVNVKLTPLRLYVYVVSVFYVLCMSPF